MAHVYFTPWLFMHVIIQYARICFISMSIVMTYFV
jgi:hypothetical protein